jgi:hypothetical protein
VRDDGDALLVGVDGVVELGLDHPQLVVISSGSSE